MTKLTELVHDALTPGSDIALILGLASGILLALGSFTHIIPPEMAWVKFVLWVGLVVFGLTFLVGILVRLLPHH
jgi:hypothetical protein